MSSHVIKATEYELFVRDVYKRLFAVEGVENPKIEHNVIFTGKSGAPHQIDVYWEFTLAGVRHRVAVECKNYKNSVKKEKIAGFKGVLDDIAGNVQGIYATRVGYQSGALKFCESYGIQPMIIRKPEDEDWTGYIREINISLHLLTHENTHIQFEGDSEWLIENMPELAKSENGMFGIYALNIDTFIDDQDAQVIKSICEYQNELPREKAGRNYLAEYEYQNAYLICRGTRYKIKKMQINYDVVESIDEIHIRADQMILAIVKNSLECGEKLIGFDGRVIDR